MACNVLVTVAVLYFTNCCIAGALLGGMFSMEDTPTAGHALVCNAAIASKHSGWIKAFGRRKEPINIHKRLDHAVLMLKLEGRLDTITSPQLNAVVEIFDITGLIDLLTIE